jgi:hypothetical protein
MVVSVMVNRKSIRTLLVAVFALSLGFIAGHSYARYKFMEIISQGPAAIRPLVLKRMRASLSLTDEQMKALEPILKELQSEGTRIRMEAVPEVLNAFRQARSQAKPILTAEQLAIVDSQAKRIEMHLRNQS